MQEDRLREYKKELYREKILSLGFVSGFGSGVVADALLEIDDELSDPDFEIPEGFRTKAEKKRLYDKYIKCIGFATTRN